MKLVFPNGDHAQALLKPGVNSVGSATHNTFVLTGPKIPALAAEIHVLGSYVHLTAGTCADVYVNGCEASGSIPLRNGDQLLMAGIHANVVALTEEFKSGAERPGSSVALQTRPLANASNYLLHDLTGPVFGRLYALPCAIVVGRAPECDFILSMPDVSRRHASLRPSTSGVLVGDLGSRNGVYINDRKVQHGILIIGDELRLASHRFLLCAPEMSPATRSNPTTSPNARKSA